MAHTMALFAAMVIVFVSLSAWAGRAYLSAPMVFMVGGFVLGRSSFAGLEAPTIQTIAELTLALLLFQGAAELEPRHLRDESVLTGRLLLVALPLTIVACYLLVRLAFPQLDPWLALLLAGALAPTDSALSAASVLNPVVPARIRRVLNLESGLNDGIATPVVLFAIAGAGTGIATAGADEPVGALLAIVVGVVFGVVSGVGAGRLLREAGARGWADEHLVPVAVLVIPLLSYYGAAALGGNGFMAAFIAGTAFATTQVTGVRVVADLRLTTSMSALLGCAAWMLFGAATATHLDALLRWQPLLVAVLSLTVLRAVPVALSLAGAGLRWQTVAFVGWFGPRGLPSVVFALIAQDALRHHPELPAVMATIAMTVVLSVLVHGLSAPPLSVTYGRWVQRQAPMAERL